MALIFVSQVVKKKKKKLCHNKSKRRNKPHNKLRGIFVCVVVKEKPGVSVTVCN